MSSADAFQTSVHPTATLRRHYSKEVVNRCSFVARRCGLQNEQGAAHAGQPAASGRAAVGARDGLDAASFAERRSEAARRGVHRAATDQVEQRTRIAQVQLQC